MRFNFYDNMKRLMIISDVQTMYDNRSLKLQVFVLNVLTLHALVATRDEKYGFNFAAALRYLYVTRLLLLSLVLTKQAKLQIILRLNHAVIINISKLI